MKIAVISDLHCHGPEEYDGKKRESFLVANDPRLPPNQSIIQSLLDLISALSLRTQVVLCAGDLANKTSSQGLSYSWDILRNDVKDAFESDLIIATIGNHDVTSRGVGDPFNMARHIHREFLFEDEEHRNSFWQNGFSIVEYGEIATILVINTTYDHYDSEAAKRGTFGTERIEILRNELSRNTLLPIRIAVLHHHPILHTLIDYNLSDVLATGDVLLDTLGDFQFHLVVHGHRHIPRVRRYISSAGHTLFILAAGTFSKYLKELGSRTRNVFHLIDVSVDDGDNSFNGKMNTWEFNLGKGWSPTTKQSSELPHTVFLGPQPDTDLKEAIKDLFHGNSLSYIAARQLHIQFPNLKFLLPDELNDLERRLSIEENLQVEYTELGEISGIGKNS